MWGQTGRAPFLSATELKEKLVNVPSVPRFPPVCPQISPNLRERSPPNSQFFIWLVNSVLQEERLPGDERSKSDSQETSKRALQSQP
jgi:hypothetical protein